MLRIFVQVFYIVFFIFSLWVSGFFLVMGLVSSQDFNIEDFVSAIFVSNIYFVPFLYVFLIKTRSFWGGAVGILLSPLALVVHYVLSAVCAHAPFFWIPIAISLEFMFYLCVCLGIKRYTGL